MMSAAGRRRGRVAAVLLTVSLLAVASGVWVTPGLRWPGPSASADEIALGRDEARIRDLKHQLDSDRARLMQPRPIIYDAVERARADDLERQVNELEDKLGIPHPPRVDGSQRARANDLAARLHRAEQVLAQRRPPAVDLVAAARARDLAAQNDRLTAELTRPRPTIDPLATVTTTVTKADIVTAAHMWGLYTTQSPFDYSEVNLIQTTVGRKANIVGYFQSWADPFNERPIRNAWAHGQIPLLTWESQNQVGAITADQPAWSLPTIIGGAHDDQIHAYARGIAHLRLPLIVRLDHEMNGTWYPWSENADRTGTPVNGNHVGDYQAMWRHVHDIFQADGANDYVVWLWSPNRVNRICGQRPPAAFYPGSDVVDWVGMSGYYRHYAVAANDCDDIAPTFDGVFGRTLPLLRQAAPGKPLFLSEIGAAEDGGHKVEFIDSLFAGLAANPDIAGFAWFNLAVSSANGEDRVSHDWRVNSSGPSARAIAGGLDAGGYGAPAG
jgi:mannan endo-1,4-beta-mannosidase